MVITIWWSIVNSASQSRLLIAFNLFGQILCNKLCPIIITRIKKSILAIIIRSQRRPFVFTSSRYNNNIRINVFIHTFTSQHETTNVCFIAQQQRESLQCFFYWSHKTTSSSPPHIQLHRLIQFQSLYVLLLCVCVCLEYW